MAPVYVRYLIFDLSVSLMMGRVLFVNGHIWQSERERVPAASWLLISQREILAVGVGDVPTEHR